MLYTTPHCSYLDIYISRKIRLCVVDLEGKFQTNLQAKLFGLEIQIYYRISANSFRGNYSFLNLALFTVTFDLYFINLNSCRGNYSREETIQGRKLFAEIRYTPWYFGRVVVPQRLINLSIYHEFLLLQKFNELDF